MSNKRLKVSHHSKSRGTHLEPSASISDLPNDLLKHCFSFMPGQYITVAPVSRHFHSNYSTVGIHESTVFSSSEMLLKIGQNKLTTADAISSEVSLTEYCFLQQAPKEFIKMVCQKAAMKGRRDVIECAVTFGVDFVKDILIDTSRYRVLGVRSDVIDMLGEEGNLDMIKYFDKRFDCFKGYDWDIDANKAVKAGNLHVVKWFQERLGKYQFYRTNKHLGYTALMNGNLEILRWCESIDHYGSITNDEHTRRYAARSGNVDILKFVQEKYGRIFNEDIFAGAAASGCIEMVEYCLQNNCPFNGQAYFYALQSKDKTKAVQMVRWLRQHDIPWNEESCADFAEYDDLELLKWIRNEGCPWNNERIISIAAKNGNIGILEYCLENGCPRYNFACEEAMKTSNHTQALNTLKWLLQHSFSLNNEACIQAAARGNFEVMMWMWSNGYALDKESVVTSIAGASVSELEYILQNHLNFISLEEAFDEIIKFNRDEYRTIEKIMALHRHGYRKNTRACALAAMHGKFQVLKWLRHNGYPWDVETCNGAVRKNSLEILKYAHDNGCEWDKNTYAHCFSRDGLNEAVDVIPIEPMRRYDKILKYLGDYNCPRPVERDWILIDGDDDDELGL